MIAVQTEAMMATFEDQEYKNRMEQHEMIGRNKIWQAMNKLE